MTGARIRYTLDDKAYRQWIDRLGGAVSPPLMRAIGTGLVEQVNQRFDRGADVWGIKWKPLLPAYAAIKRGPGILRASLRLQRSITMATTSNEITVGTNVIYGAVHQFGGVIKAKTPKGLAFRLGGKVGPRGGKGTFLVHVKSVTIPARPYLGFGPNDERAVMETIKDAFDRASRI